MRKRFFSTLKFGIAFFLLLLLINYFSGEPEWLKNALLSAALVMMGFYAGLKKGENQ